MVLALPTAGMAMHIGEWAITIGALPITGPRIIMGGIDTADRLILFIMEGEV